MMKMKMMAAIVASVMVFCACADLVPSNSYDVSAYSEDGIDGAMLTLMFWGGVGASVTHLEFPNEVEVDGKMVPVLAMTGRLNPSNSPDVEEVTFPNQLRRSETTDGSGVFFYWYNLKTVNFPSTMKIWSDNMFYGCSQLETITIPQKLLEIPYQCFYECTRLTNVIFSAQAECTNICNWAFVFSPLTNIQLPTSLTTIGEYAFGESLLETITIPGGVETIGKYAFSRCANLTSVVIQDGVKKISTSAFYGCKKMDSLQLSSTLEIILEDAFRDCYSLDMIILPASVTNVDRYAFLSSATENQVNRIIWSKALPESLDLLANSKTEFRYAQGPLAASLAWSEEELSGEATVRKAQLVLCKLTDATITNLRFCMQDAYCSDHDFAGLWDLAQAQPIETTLTLDGIEGNAIRAVPVSATLIKNKNVFVSDVAAFIRGDMYVSYESKVCFLMYDADGITYYLPMISGDGMRNYINAQNPAYTSSSTIPTDEATDYTKPRQCAIGPYLAGLDKLRVTAFEMTHEENDSLSLAMDVDMCQTVGDESRALNDRFVMIYCLASETLDGEYTKIGEEVLIGPHRSAFSVNLPADANYHFFTFGIVGE